MGKDWGDQGYCYMPYNHLINWRWLAIAFIRVPWLNFLLLAAGILALFRRAGSHRS